MDDSEVARLRKAIRLSYNSSPHKKKYWMALLDMHVEAQKRAATEQTSTPPTTAPSDPPEGSHRPGAGAVSAAPAEHPALRVPLGVAPRPGRSPSRRSRTRD